MDSSEIKINILDLDRVKSIIYGLEQEKTALKAELRDCNHTSAQYILLLEAQVEDLRAENEKLKQELDKAEFALQERIASAFLEKAISKIVEKVIAEQSKPGGLLYK